MSYDLAFLVSEEEPPITREFLEDYFARRANYQVSQEQAFYSNDATGVYFYFSYDDGEAVPTTENQPASSDGLRRINVAFSLNYFRPHIFGLEAALELSAFVEKFGVKIDDPQEYGMGRGEFSSEAFVRAWNSGNFYGYRELASRLAEDAQALSGREKNVLSSEEIERVWRWNYQKAALQASLGGSVFVPTINFVRHRGKVRSFVVWGDAVPIALPMSDLVVLYREALAPFGLFGRKKGVALVEHQVLRPLLPEDRLMEAAEDFHLLTYRTPPAPVANFFKSQPLFKEKLEGLAKDQVLDEELMTRALARRQSNG